MAHDRASDRVLKRADIAAGAVPRLRLDRWLAEATGASRSAVRAWLRAGRVRVGGEAAPVRAVPALAGETPAPAESLGASIVSDPALKVAVEARVWLDGDLLDPPTSRTVMLHKPAGVVSATHDPHWPTVLGLVNATFAHRLRVVGRLDRDTTGLILLTDDGDYLHRVSRPGGVWKRYRVTLDAPLLEAAAEALRRGVKLKDDPAPAVARRLEPVPDTAPGHPPGSAGRVWRIAIDEGRYHQVKRMFAAVGARVIALHREAIGALELDATLAPGQWRCLTAPECVLALQRVR